MKTVTIEYYAQLREQAGRDREPVATHAVTLRELYAELQANHGFTLPADLLKVAANAVFCDWDRDVVEGDVIVFIPPVAGG